jgi:uncharacterized protein (DUF2336 family)
MVAPYLLTQDDVSRLINEPSPDVRLDIVAKLTNQYISFSSQEKMVADQLLLIFVKDSELMIRKMIAKNLRSNPNIPHDVAFQLAQDVHDVSIPILEISTVLTDEDLISIIENDQDLQKNLSISRRNVVSSAVSGTLINTENDQVVDSLLKNEGSVIIENDLNHIIDSFGDNETLMKSLGDKQNIPPQIQQKIMARIATVIESQLQDKNQDAALHIQQTVQSTSDLETIKILEQNVSEQTSAKDLLVHLFKASQLTGSLLMTMLCLGKIRLFQISMAIIADIPIKNAGLLIEDIEGIGFKSLYDKIDVLPGQFFMAVKILLRYARQVEAKTSDKFTGHSNITEIEFMRILEKMLHDHIKREQINNIEIIINIMNNISTSLR